MGPFIWIIDEEWSDYKIETEILKKNFPDCKIHHSGNDFRNELSDIAPKADAVIAQINIGLNAGIIAALAKCKIISVYGTGYNNVDVAAALEKGITVCNVPSYCVEDVSDYVIAAVYHFNKTLGLYDSKVKNGLWGAQAVSSIINRISSATLHIIGLGRIGFEVARKARALGMDVVYTDDFQSDERGKELGIRKVSLEDGLSMADYVTVHTKLTKDTEKFVNSLFFNKMKSNAYFINCSRGGVVNEQDLVSAVKNKKIAGAMLDVVTQEPPDYSAEIFSCDGIWITPHIAYLSEDALRELQYTAAENVVLALQGKELQNKVLN